LSLPEFLDAVEGYLERKGVTGGERMTLADYEAALAGVDENGALLALA
jgi:hypothetical protein